MADSRRQKLVDAIVARMKLINGTGDYELDLDNRVKDSESNWGENDYPAVSVYDGDAEANPTSPGAYTETIHAMSVMIEGFTGQHADGPKNARKLLKDINTAIRVDDKWIVSNVPLAMQTREVRSNITRDQANFQVEGCQIEIMVQFKTPKFNAE